MAMIRILARADADVAVIPPIVVRDEPGSGTLVEPARLNSIMEGLFAVTLRFPSPMVREVPRDFTLGER